MSMPGSAAKTSRRLVLGGLWSLVAVVVLCFAAGGTSPTTDAPLHRSTGPSDDGDGSAPHRFEATSQSLTSCRDASTCLSCLFRVEPSSDSTRADAQESPCVWCASERRCVDRSAEVACVDLEASVCPAVLHTPIPQTMRVLHVAIRKGGPEALIQLHLALNHWGFGTTLDTRKSKKQKGGPVVPYFLEVYKREFDAAPPLRYEADYERWLESGAEGDVLIATETWPCRNDWRTRILDSRGARQMQWHLTVWPKKDRSSCTIATHTNYLAEVYMKAPRRSLLFPYINPKIVELAAQLRAKGTLQSSKENLVMYDGDVKLSDADVRPVGSKYAVQKATGFTPEALYAKYAAAKAGIDLDLPGAERFVYEASLFDTCVIVDRQNNGLDEGDVPLPGAFRVPPNDPPALHAAIRRCVDDYSTSIAQQAPLRAHTLQQRERFHRHVRRYFSNSVHVVTSVATQAQADRFLVPFILHTLIAVPFASIEVRLGNGVRPTSVPGYGTLLSHSYLAAVTFADAARRLPLTQAKRTAYVVGMPATVWLTSGELVHAAASAVALMTLPKGATSSAVVVDQRAPLAFARSGNRAALSAIDASLAATGGKNVAEQVLRQVDGPSLDVGVLRPHGGKPAWVRWLAPTFEHVSVDGSAGAVASLAQLPPMQALASAVEPSSASTTTWSFLCSHPLYSELLPAVCDTAA